MDYTEINAASIDKAIVTAIEMEKCGVCVGPDLILDMASAYAVFIETRVIREDMKLDDPQPEFDFSNAGVS